jgi:ABC-type multidrug transport system ATPase subunit
VAAHSAIELVGVDRHFGEVTALEGLSVAVAPGEVVALLGHNGAGKTTTVRLLAGLLAPDAGTVRVRGLDPAVDGPAVRRQLGVLPAAPVVDDRLTGVANLRFAADVFGVPTEGLEARITAALEGFELVERGDERVAGYSTGMRQRLALARVLLPDPEILLLDEPTSALDPVAARQVRRSLTALARDRARTIVLCTHDLAEAEQLADRVIVLEHGRVVADGSPAELAAEHGTGGLQLEVGADDLEVARAGLAALAVGEVEMEPGGRLRAMGIARDAVPGLVARLSADGVAIYELRRLDPTLEDVYLAIHDRAPAPASGPDRTPEVTP